MADTKAPPAAPDTASAEGSPGRSGGSVMRRAGIVLALAVAGFALLAHAMGGKTVVIVIIAGAALLLLFLLLRFLPRLQKHFGNSGKRARTRRTRTTRTRQFGSRGAGARRGMPGAGRLSARRGGGRAGSGGGKGLSGTKRRAGLGSGGRAGKLGRSGGTKAGGLAARRGGAKTGATARKGLARRSGAGAPGTGKAAGTRRGILSRKGASKGGAAPGTRRRKGLASGGPGRKGGASARGPRSLRHPLGGKRSARPTGTGTKKGTGGRRGSGTGTPGRRRGFIPFRGRRPGGAGGGKGSTGRPSGRKRPFTTSGKGTTTPPKQKSPAPKSKWGKRAWWTLGLPVAAATAGGAWAWRKGKARRAARNAARAKFAPPPRGHQAAPGGKNDHRWVRAAGARFRRARAGYRRWAPWSKTAPAHHAAPKVTENRPRWHRRAWAKVSGWRPSRRREEKNKTQFRYWVRPPAGEPKEEEAPDPGQRMPDPATAQSTTQAPPDTGRTEYHPGGTVGTSPIAQATEAMDEAVGSYDPEHMGPVTDWLDDLPEWYDRQAAAMNTMLERLRSEYPLDPAVADHYESLVSTLTSMGEHAREGIGVYRAAHEADLARHEEPRTNEAAWDVSNNPNN